MKILITGSSGRVGKAVVSELLPHYSLRLADIRPPSISGVEFLQGDITHQETVKQWVQGIDAIIHLAYGRADARPPSMSPEEWSVEVNVKGTYLLLYEAVHAGVQKVVSASTLSLYEGNPPQPSQVYTEETPPNPGRWDYAQTKYLEEEVLRVFALGWGLHCLCLRLTGVTTPEEKANLPYPHPERAFPYTSTRDVAQAFRKALEYPGKGFEVFHITSNNHFSRWDITKARTLLGYSPLDTF